MLEVGSPSAYLAALLSQLAARVYSLTRDASEAKERLSILAELGCNNVHVVVANPTAGWPDASPYQAIVVGAGAPAVPRELVDQLDVGGRLVIPVGDADAQLLECLRKRPEAIEAQTLGSCHMAMLAGAPRAPSRYPWTRPRET